jgi:hypothetical protein
MGYYSLDPLGRGFFRIDPAATLPPEALAFYSENQMFHAPNLVVGEVSEEVTEKIAKEIAEEVAETVSKNIGEQVSETVAEKTAKEVMQQAYKNVQEAAIEKNGRQLSGAALTNALRKEAKALSEQSLEVSLKTTAGEVAETAAKKTAKQLTPKQKAIKESIEAGGRRVVVAGTVGAVAYGLGAPVAESIGDAIGDAGSAIFGGDCDRSELEKNYPDATPTEIDAKLEACQDKAAKNVMLLGAAGIGVAGLLGLVVISRLIPKRASQPEAQGA